jgi:hypothetical protein
MSSDGFPAIVTRPAFYSVLVLAVTAGVATKYHPSCSINAITSRIFMIAPRKPVA